VVSADQLAQVLGNHPPLRLVVINACQGAQSAADDASAGVAQRLVAGGTPSVAAMQFAITDKAAALFSSEFYAALGRGLSVDEAMQRARQAIYTQPNAVEWATPVLFAAKGEPLRIVAREPMYATEPVESMAANSAADTAVPTTERSAKQVGTGPKNRPWLLAAVGTLALIAIFAFAWLGRGVGTVAPAPSAAATAHATTTIAGEATTVPGGTSTATPPANALAGTQEPASTPLPTARPPITVGLASLAGCVLEGVDADYREALADPLRNTRLLGNRIIMVDVPSAIGNAADALAAGKSGGYDIVLWGACAPGAEGGTSSAGGTGAVSETLTVTATLLLVGDTADEALAHRLAQPDAVALSVDSEQAALVGEALASVLAYYGEDNIEYAARLLDSIAARLDTVDAATQWQRASFHWLAGNAFVEHPELVLGQYFNKERRVSPYYREQGILHFARAISLTLSLSPSVPVGPIVAALHQNRGWMHIRIADPVLMEAEYAHALEDFTLSTAYAPPTEGAIEGLVAAQQWLGLGKDELVALCEPLAMLDPAVRYRNCRTYAEIYQEGANLAAMRQLAGAVLAIAPHDAPSEYFLALVACDLEHDSARAISHHQRYEAKARIAPRWDIFGWELERHLSADILRNILADPVTACGTS
jgi:hypothetical protein